jgi:predicted dehydrogenase
MRVSIIGVGRIGFSLENDPLRYKPCTHVGAIQSLIKKGAPIEWNYLCDLNVEKITECEKFISGKKNVKTFKRNNAADIHATPDYRKVISAKPDILVIAADTMVHHKIAIDAIKAGIPRIILEKPVAPTYKQSAQIYKQAKKAGAHVWINYERRYHSKYRQLKKDILGRVYGAPLYYRGWFASSNSSLFKAGSGNEGALLHDSTHLVDLSIFLFGDVKKYDRKLPAKNLHTLAFSHKNGVNGEIMTTINNRFFHFELEIFFEHARVKVENGFTIVENLEQSKLYKNFTSLSLPQIIPDKKMQVKNNPFINLYTDVIHDNYQASFLKDACQNIRYLT